MPYLFRWEEVPGNDSEILIEFLMQNFNIEWIKAAKINKNDDNKTIRITNDTNFLSLTLNNEKTNVNIEINDVRTDKFIVKKENGELNIYIMPTAMYKSGYTLKIYKILEDDLVDFLKYITIDYYLGEERKKIFSPRLSELLVRIGSQVDIFFRNCSIVQNQNSKKSKDHLTFGNYKSIEKVIGLSNEKLKILATDETIIPFKGWKKWKNEDDNWWNAYNNVKHDGFINKEKGNLFNVIESLSALFLLNCIHKEIKFKLIEYGYKKINQESFGRIIQGNIEEDLYFELNTYPFTTSQLFEFEKIFVIPKVILPQKKD